MRKIIVTSAFAILLAGCGSGQEATGETASADQPAGEAVSPAPVAPASAEQSTAPSNVAARPAADPIRGPGGLEAKCLARIDSETGGSGVSTNHIEESEAAIAIYVNVPGAEAPWRCLGYRDGTIGEVMYTGSEGAM